MRDRLTLAALVLAFVIAALAGCYATTSTPPGPNCIADPSNPACVQPIHDKPEPDGGAR